MTWGEFEHAAPALATLGLERFDRSGVVLVGTIRKDGTPRISPVEPVIVDGELYLGMMPGSLKALDLLRDPRVLVHSAISSRDGTEGEFKLRGTAVDVQDAERRRRYCEALYEKIGWSPEGSDFHLFAVEVESVAFVTFERGELSIQRWPEPRPSGAPSSSS